MATFLSRIFLKLAPASAGDYLPAFDSLFMQSGMQESYDVTVIGGAFSGAATALLLRREAPDLRVAVIERSPRFDRKVGEATTEISGCFLTKRLALTHHLCHHHVAKNGLRFWFSRGSEDDFDGDVKAYSGLPYLAFDNQRLARIAQKRQPAGVYGSMNLDSRTLLKGFEPNLHVRKLIGGGVGIWLRAELRSLLLPAPSSAPVESPAAAV